MKEAAEIYLNVKLHESAWKRNVCGTQVREIIAQNLQFDQHFRMSPL